VRQAQRELVNEKVTVIIWVHPTARITDIHTDRHRIAAISLTLLPRCCEVKQFNDCCMYLLAWQSASNWRTSVISRHSSDFEASWSKV